MNHERKGRLGILFTEGSSTSARQTLYGLGSRDAIGIMDPDPLCQCRFSRYVRRFHHCPSYARRPDSYLQRLIRLVKTCGYDVLFPTHEQIYLLSKFRVELGRYAALAVPEFESLRLMQNKADFIRVLQRVGLEVPPTRFVTHLSEIAADDPFPLYIKLPHSTAGGGVRRVASLEEVARVAKEFEQNERLKGVAEIVVQQAVEGVHSVVQTVFQEGRLVAAHCAEASRIGIGGGQILRASASHPRVIDDIRRLGAALRWHGPLFLEYFYDPVSGSARYIEANPRIGETFNAVLCGVNLSRIWLQVALGSRVEPVISQQQGVRSHGGFLLLIASAMEGATRTELLREIRAIRGGTAPYHSCENEITRGREDWLSTIPMMATVARLLISPGQAQRIVRRAVDNYALSEADARGIDELAWPIAAGDA